MQQMADEPEILQYRWPGDTPPPRSWRSVTSVVCTALTAYPFYEACHAVVDSHSMPGHYFPLMTFSYLFWFVLLGAGVGIYFGVVGMRRERRWFWLIVGSLLLNVLFLAGLVVMLVLTKGGTESA